MVVGGGEDDGFREWQVQRSNNEAGRYAKAEAQVKPKCFQSDFKVREMTSSSLPVDPVLISQRARVFHLDHRSP
jgi:hypothetical protein